MADLSELGHPARVIAVFGADGLPSPPPSPSVDVYLHEVVDPGNVGTIIRAAAALGAEVVRLSRGCADPLSGKGVRASMGAIFHVADRARREAPRCTAAGCALTASAETAIWEVDLTLPVTLVVGAERAGVPYEIEAALRRCRRASRRRRPADSLNAASAATVALYEIARQRATQTESLSSSDGVRPSNQP